MKRSGAFSSSHHAVVTTPRQEKRRATGVRESSPSDYSRGSDDMRKLGKARASLEDRKMAKELGLLNLE